MPVEQVWLQESDYGMLKIMREFFEDQQNEAFGGKEYMYSRRLGRRHRMMRKKINNTYVIRLAIQELYNEVLRQKGEGIRGSTSSSSP